ncbi:MAG: hypothetical protein Q4F80_02745 [bacterium]|nr:hypothetical protein [bacterium]
MTIGAKDRIDVLLVKKYATMKVDNPTIQSSMINPEKMYEAMNDYAQMHLAMINMQQNLRETCIKAISQNIQYRKSRNLKKKVQGGAPAKMQDPELAGAG